MASVDRMTALAKEISGKTAIITDFLTSKGLEAASYDANGLAEFPYSPKDEAVFQARLNLAAATKELYDITVGPKQGLRDLAWDCTNNLSLHAIWDFDIAREVPLEGTISYEDLTAKVEANNDLPIGVLNLRRLLRHAMTNRIFCEPVRNHVAHTRSSRLLVEDEPLKSWAGFISNDVWPAVTQAVKAIRKWPASEEPTETPINPALDQSLPWSEFILQDEVFKKRYNLAMQAHGGAAGYAFEYVVRGYDWASLGTPLLSIAGGQKPRLRLLGRGRSLSEPQVCRAGPGRDADPETIGIVPDHLADRVTLTTHDFFTPQAEFAECYFFRHVFHCFSDKYSVQILHTLIPALRRGSRTIINDGALPEPGTASYLEERTARSMDCLMQVTVNTRKREADNWTQLLRGPTRGSASFACGSPRGARCS
ncbi:hypothetical protein B0T14DRAFT_498681 [Immersiella caudata]|uniref:O-methyltransferase C-terminal domain-containing protein n=1 Tax=Immersiella caudata TaxID=314043 RepID=A0AA39WLP8_9PEZI|nr:hypothetical protein B0T14DRAFT_498681 [Immersiella caudata]